jgi:hypothetical protein
MYKNCEKKLNARQAQQGVAQFLPEVPGVSCIQIVQKTYQLHSVQDRR